MVAPCENINQVPWLGIQLKDWGSEMSENGSDEVKGAHNKKRKCVVSIGRGHYRKKENYINIIEERDFYMYPARGIRVAHTRLVQHVIKVRSISVQELPTPIILFVYSSKRERWLWKREILLCVYTTTLLNAHKSREGVVRSLHFIHRTRLAYTYYRQRNERNFLINSLRTLYTHWNRQLSRKTSRDVLAAL